jgi:peptidoglycan/xylan/chitin deacetylase (PgdA/CDA1 family)
MSAAARVLRRLAARAAWSSGAASWLARLRHRRAPCVALLFHRVTGAGHPPGRFAMGEISADDFLARLEWLRRVADLLPADEWLAERRLPPRPGRPRVLVTFDDGYRDFAEVALPACASLGVRPLLFVSTGFADDRRARPWWDWPRRAARTPPGAAGDLARWERLAFEDPDGAAARVAAEAAAQGWDPPSPSEPNEFCDWETLRSLRARADLGAHGALHAPFSRLSPARLAEELRLPAARMAAELGERPPLLAYPYGDARAVSPPVLAAAAEAGYRAAFRADGPPDARGAAEFDLPRVVFPEGPVWRFASHWARLRPRA